MEQIQLPLADSYKGRYKFQMNWLNLFKNYLARTVKKRSLPLIDDGTKPWVKAKKSDSNQLKSVAGTKETGTTKVSRNISNHKEAKWIFQVVAGVDRGREYIGFTKEIRVGRHPENLILLRDPKVSRFHALFYIKGVKLFIEDLGSTNGTKVNDVLISKRTQVIPGDQIKIGETVIQITLDK